MENCPVSMRDSKERPKSTGGIEFSPCCITAGAVNSSIYPDDLDDPDNPTENVHNCACRDAFFIVEDYTELLNFGKCSEYKTSCYSVDIRTSTPGFFGFLASAVMIECTAFNNVEFRAKVLLMIRSMGFKLGVDMADFEKEFYYKSFPDVVTLSKLFESAFLQVQTSSQIELSKWVSPFPTVNGKGPPVKPSSLLQVGLNQENSSKPKQRPRSASFSGTPSNSPASSLDSSSFANSTNIKPLVQNVSRTKTLQKLYGMITTTPTMDLYSMLATRRQNSPSFRRNALIRTAQKLREISSNSNSPSNSSTKNHPEGAIDGAISNSLKFNTSDSLTHERMKNNLEARSLPLSNGSQLFQQQPVLSSSVLAVWPALGPIERFSLRNCDDQQLFSSASESGDAGDENQINIGGIKRKHNPVCQSGQGVPSTPQIHASFLGGKSVRMPSSFGNAAALSRRKRFKFFKKENNALASPSNVLIKPKGVYNTKAGGFRVQLNQVKGSSTKFSRNVKSYSMAVWLYEVAVLLSDRPKDLETLLSSGNYMSIKSMQWVNSQSDYYHQLGARVIQFANEEVLHFEEKEPAITTFDEMIFNPNDATASTIICDGYGNSIDDPNATTDAHIVTARSTLSTNNSRGCIIQNQLESSISNTTCNTADGGELVVREGESLRSQHKTCTEVYRDAIFTQHQCPFPSTSMSSSNEPIPKEVAMKFDQHNSPAHQLNSSSNSMITNNFYGTTANTSSSSSNNNYRQNIYLTRNSNNPIIACVSREFDSPVHYSQQQQEVSAVNRSEFSSSGRDLKCDNNNDKAGMDVDNSDEHFMHVTHVTSSSSNSYEGILSRSNNVTDLQQQQSIPLPLITTNPFLSLSCPIATTSSSSSSSCVQTSWPASLQSALQPLPPSFSK